MKNLKSYFSALSALNFPLFDQLAVRVRSWRDLLVYYNCRTLFTRIHVYLVIIPTIISLLPDLGSLLSLAEFLWAYLKSTYKYIIKDLEKEGDSDREKSNILLASFKNLFSMASYCTWFVPSCLLTIHTSININILWNW